MLYDLIIIGAGPAGVTAGIYAARKRLKTLVLSKDLLGQPAKTSWVDNYPGLPHIKGLELAQKLEQHLQSFVEQDVLEIKEDEVIALGHQGANVFIASTASGDQYQARSLIIATGRDPRPLEVPGEKRLIGKGVSYCSVCDTPFFKGKTVAVIGGGNSGLEAALDLASFAKKIFILEYQAQLPGDYVLQERLKKMDLPIQILLSKKLTRIEGNDKVEAIVYKDVSTHKTFQVGVDGVLVAVGTVPVTVFLSRSDQGLNPLSVELNERDEIRVDPQTCATSDPGVFAPGDVNNTPWKQIVTATGQGCVAALEAYQYLQKTNQ